MQFTRNPIQLLVNYWEIRPAAMGSRLDEFLKQGVHQIASFIPWQAVESDISHTLARFLLAIHERDMRVSLILTPEVGVHYANSGFPKDLLSKSDMGAKDSKGESIPVALPPNAFTLPSLLAPEFGKRYHNFLVRIDNLLADLERLHPGLLKRVNLVLTGSLWKYYRGAGASSKDSFSATAGDYSSTASVAYRKSLEQFYSSREFLEEGIAEAQRWKTRALDELNRKWFYQSSEDVFRARSVQFVRKRAIQTTLTQAELYTPEADPGFSYSNFLQLVSGGNADFCRLSKLVDEASQRITDAGSPQPGAQASSAVPQAGVSHASPMIHWTGLGGFRSLTDSEKQFLVLKSLLLMGAQGGGLFIDEGEWFSFSHSFRVRAEGIARAIGEKEFWLENRALYLAPHSWSKPGSLWDALSKRLGASARITASLDLATGMSGPNLLIVDPGVILTKEKVRKLSDWAKGSQSGSTRMVVLPRSTLYSRSASQELEDLLAQGSSMQIDLGLSYVLHPVKSNGNGGRIVVYDLPDEHSNADLFVGSLISVAGLQSPCSLSDGRLDYIPLERQKAQGSEMGLFVLNSRSRPVTADLIFPVSVSVSDLAREMTSKEKQTSAIEPANRFALEVPPCGILPIGVSGLNPVETSIKDEFKESAHALSEALSDAQLGEV
jgi:hypothetical protein